jgi:membrane associated rhomboid family serine protease
MKNETCHYDDVLKHMCFSFTYPHQIWRMITVNLLHFRWLHLLSNLLAQLVQGIPLERKYGSARVAVIYWLSGLGASLSLAVTNRRTRK